MDNSNLYYALESLPELLGERQFQALVDALGVRDDYRSAKADLQDRFDRGAFIARCIVHLERINLEKRIVTPGSMAA